MPDWPHSPLHLLDSSGAYIVTAATYRKLPIFRSRGRLDLLLSHFPALAVKYGIALQAWAMFPNHYHFIGVLNDSGKLRTFVQHFHSLTAREVNRLDNTRGRKVWFQYWESHLTFERSYFARLRYVHENAVHHGVVRRASNYPWCSATWFESNGNASFRKTISKFPCDKLDIADSFDVKIDDFAGEQFDEEVSLAGAAEGYFGSAVACYRLLFAEACFGGILAGSLWRHEAPTDVATPAEENWRTLLQ